jgi:hypothetical protein
MVLVTLEEGLGGTTKEREYERQGREARRGGQRDDERRREYEGQGKGEGRRGEDRQRRGQEREEDEKI